MPQAALFPPGDDIPSSLAAWHTAFARLAPDASESVELWFDRGAHRPVCERLRLPRYADDRDRRLGDLYVAALVNNVLCTRGARSVTVRAANRDTVRQVEQALERLLFLQPDGFSNMSLHFLHGLVRQVYGAPFTVDADPDHAAALRRRAETPADAPVGASPPHPGMCLAINIGQHLTSLALVRLFADGRFEVTGLRRQATWPEKARQCLSAAWEELLDAAARLSATTTEPVDALGISIAATVTGGAIRPVPEFGLFAECAAQELDAVAVMARRARDRLAPGRLCAVVNDGEAQALFAASAGARPLQGDMLSMRLGACPAVHRLDAAGRAAAGFHEYGWLVTRYDPGKAQGGLFTTPRLYLSHYGVAMAAYELGLLQKYRLPHQAAIAFFHEALTRGEPVLMQDAAHVYGVLGAHLAMLAHETHRLRPLKTIRLLGSRANRLDEPVFRAMTAGFDAFCRANGLETLAAVDFDLLQETSVVAGLVGAARAALAAPA